MPGKCIGIVMDYVPGTRTLGGDRLYGGAEAVTSFEIDRVNDMPAFYAMVAAGRYGERIAPDPSVTFHHGDDRTLLFYATREEIAEARRVARRLVKKHEMAIRRVARLALEQRVAHGDAIRERI